MTAQRRCAAAAAIGLHSRGANLHVTSLSADTEVLRVVSNNLRHVNPVCLWDQQVHKINDSHMHH